MQFSLQHLSATGNQNIQMKPKGAQKRVMWFFFFFFFGNVLVRNPLCFSASFCELAFFTSWLIWSEPRMNEGSGRLRSV